MNSCTDNNYNDVSANANHIANINPIRYRSYYYDTETGFYYLQSRYYDPVIGRFLNVDGFVSTGLGFLGYNMFAYCLGNPVAYTDSTGCDPVPRCVKNVLYGNPKKQDNQDVLDLDVNAYAGSARYIVQKAYNAAVAYRNSLRDVTEEIETALNSSADSSILFAYFTYKSFGPETAMSIVYLRFATMVNHHARWDIKEKLSWEDSIGTTFPGKGVTVVFNNKFMTPEALGNYTYGYLGCAHGIDINTLYAGSYFAAGFPTDYADLENEFTDWRYITYGYEAAKRKYQ